MRHGSLTGLALTLALALLIPSPASAIELNGSGVLSGPAFLPEIDDEVLVFVSNTGRRALRVEILLLRADDFSVVSASGPVQIAGKSTGSSAFIPSDFPVLVVVRYRAQGRTSAQVSLQVRDADGATRIFTDGFESGDTSG